MSITAVASSTSWNENRRPRDSSSPPDAIETAAVVDHAAGFVAEEVRVQVRAAERARAFDDEALAHRELAEREVARRRIAQDVDAAQREVDARAVRDPRVLANLEADANVAELEHEVADRELADRAVVGGALEHVDLARRPRLEPARLVVNAVAGEELLGDEADDHAVGEQRGGVVQRLLVIDAAADRDDHAAGQRRERVELRERDVLQAVHEERVLAAVSGDRELGQAQQRHALGARVLDRDAQVREVRVPRERRLVHTSDRDLDELHRTSYRLSLRCSTSSLAVLST